jgi:hypothetical protein
MDAMPSTAPPVRDLPDRFGVVISHRPEPRKRRLGGRDRAGRQRVGFLGNHRVNVANVRGRRQAPTLPSTA